jgi:uncharacterized protein (TIGR03545 family)
MTNTTTPPKMPKKKGPIRTEAVIPFILVCALFYVFFHFFFDSLLKSSFEYAGYQLLGAQVDIKDVETSFFKGTFRVRGIEITDADKPTNNMVSIGDIRFGVLWDGLLRARIAVEEMAVETIEFGKARKSPGKVKPPEPVQVNDGQPSAMDKLKDKALDKVESKYNNNLLGDLAALAGGASSEDQSQKIEGTLASKAKLKEIENNFQAQQKKWNDKIKTLPKGSEIQSFGDRLGKVKTKDFKSPQELQASIQEIDTIFKEADSKVKDVQNLKNELDTDLKNLDQSLKELDSLVKADIKNLESRFRIPSLDAKSITESIFRPYLDPYLAKFNRYKGLITKYAPPNLMKKGEPDPQIQPHPRAKGVTYEFGNKNSYPLFWIKKISVSSQAGTSPNAGNIKGLVTDVTSNQLLIGRPTVAQIAGDFPDMKVFGFATNITIDNRQEKSKVDSKFAIGSYPINGRDLVQSTDLTIAMNEATASLSMNGQLIGLKDFQFQLNNRIQNIGYSIVAKDQTANEMLKGIFDGIPTITVDASGRGELPGITLSINSNLGPELAKGFEKQVQKKLAEARAKLEEYVNKEVGKEKAKLEAEVSKARAQVEGEVKKIQDQLNAEKAKAEAKTKQAQNEASNQARKSAEDQVKKALGNDGEKKIDDLKKRFGL